MVCCGIIFQYRSKLGFPDIFQYFELILGLLIVYTYMQEYKIQLNYYQILFGQYLRFLKLVLIVELDKLTNLKQRIGHVLHE